MLGKMLKNINPNSEMSLLVRKAIMTAFAMVAFCVAAFQLATWAGWVVIGLSFVLVEWVSDPNDSPYRRR